MKKKIKLTSLLAISCFALLLTGCASIRNPKDPQDPYQKINEKTFKFNENLDNQVFKPIAKGYAKIVPSQARTGISNFFQNLDQPSVVANDILQGDFVHAMGDSWRFFINSTFGLLGIFDVASKMNVPIPYHANDFGLTLADWGLNDPKYVVIPFFGPSTDVDFLGRLVDYYAFKPYWYIEPYYLRYSALGLFYLNQRAELLQYNNLMEAAALDPYVFIRNAYLQKRKAQLEQIQEFVDAEYASLEDNEPGYFLKPTHPWANSKSDEKAK